MTDLFFNSDLLWLWVALRNYVVLPVASDQKTLPCVVLRGIDKQYILSNLEDLLIFCGSNH